MEGSRLVGVVALVSHELNCRRRAKAKLVKEGVGHEAVVNCVVDSDGAIATRGIALQVFDIGNARGTVGSGLGWNPGVGHGDSDIKSVVFLAESVDG